MKNEHKKPGRPPSKEAQRRIQITTKLDNVLLRRLRSLAYKEGKRVNQILEEAARLLLKKRG